MFTLRFRQLILVNETDEPVGPIGLMVCRAIVANQDLDPEDNLLTRAGVKIPHPEPYAGEPDLEHFEVFVAGILQWLSMNLLLGSSDKCTLVQLRFLGTRLTGDALEWYSCEVECYTIPAHPTISGMMNPTTGIPLLSRADALNVPHMWGFVATDIYASTSSPCALLDSPWASSCGGGCK